MSPGMLIQKQNPDGGWPYVRGKSWTEPTVYAVLALLAAGDQRPAGPALAWLRSIQRPDGGWPPQADVDESTWVTGLVALLPPERLGPAYHERAVRWLLRLSGEESTTVYRLREWLLGFRRAPAMEHAGWPWVPGSASWVAPSAVALIALQKAFRRNPSAALRERIETGRRFLLSRTCPQGGWNHGGVPDLGPQARAYPEVTGMALAALRGVSSPRIARALDLARGFLAECRSADGLNWLRLGLAAHGGLPHGYCPPREVAYRTLPEISLEYLASSGDKGAEAFWG